MTEQEPDPPGAIVADPQLIARLRHKVQRAAIVFAVVTLVPLLLLIAFASKLPSGS